MKISQMSPAELSEQLRGLHRKAVFGIVDPPETYYLVAAQVIDELRWRVDELDARNHELVRALRRIGGTGHG